MSSQAGLLTQNPRETVQALFEEGKHAAIAQALKISDRSEGAKIAIQDFVESFGPESSMKDIAIAAHLLIARENPKLEDGYVRHAANAIKGHLVGLATSGAASSLEFEVEVAGLRQIFREHLDNHREHMAVGRIISGVREAHSHLQANKHVDEAAIIKKVFELP